MGDVIEVKFGLERSWDELQQSIEDGIRLRLNQFQPEKADRAAQIASETIRLMRELDSQTKLELTTTYKIPPGISAADAATIADSVSNQLADQMQTGLRKIVAEAEKRIIDAVTGTVLLVLA